MEGLATHEGDDWLKAYAEETRLRIKRENKTNLELRGAIYQAREQLGCPPSPDDPNDHIRREQLVCCIDCLEEELRLRQKQHKPLDMLL